MYLLAYTNKNLKGQRVKPEDIFYVGMTCSVGGLKQRLEQFIRGIEKNDSTLAPGAFIEVAKGKPYSKLRLRGHFFYAAPGL